MLQLLNCPFNGSNPLSDIKRFCNIMVTTKQVVSIIVTKVLAKSIHLENRQNNMSNVLEFLSYKFKRANFAFISFGLVTGIKQSYTFIHLNYFSQSKDQERTRYSAFYMFLCGKTDSSAPSGHLYQCHWLTQEKCILCVKYLFNFKSNHYLTTFWWF